MRTLIAFALALGLVGGWPGAADARFAKLAGSWTFDVMPQEAPPLFPMAPPPFVAFFNFGAAGTVTESDNALNPNAVVPIFPDVDILVPVSASDGFGVWKRLGFDLFRCTFTKFLFNEAGLQIAIVVTTLDLTVDRYGTLSGAGVSEFFMGAKPEGEPFFIGPVEVTGERQRVED